jgi:hypothetical protein
MIDRNQCGFIDFKLLNHFMNSLQLKFDEKDWQNLLFRIKKKRNVEPQDQRINFVEFHDLIYPITYFQMFSINEYVGWKQYFQQQYMNRKDSARNKNSKEGVYKILYGPSSRYQEDGNLTERSLKSQRSKVDGSGGL